MSHAWFALLMAALAAKVAAQTPDRFATGNAVLVQDPVVGDLIAAGRSVEVGALVSGDAVLAGGEVRVTHQVDQDLYAAGGRVSLTGGVSRNARLAGGQVIVGPRATVKGNLSAMGGEIRLEGPVAGFVHATGGHVYLNGPIGGDVKVRSGEIELGPNARIAGRLRYASEEELRRAPGAQVQGTIERIPPPSGWPVPGTVERQMGGWGSWIWTLGLTLLAAVLVAALPNFYSRVAATLQGHPGKSLLFGVVALIGLPVAALILLVTLIGIPLGLLVILLYLTLLLVGYVSTGVALGDWTLGRFKLTETGKRGWRIGAAIAVILVLGLIGRIPWVGPLVIALVVLVGVGALVLQWRSPSSPAVIR